MSTSGVAARDTSGTMRRKSRIELYPNLIGFVLITSVFQLYLIPVGPYVFSLNLVLIYAAAGLYLLQGQWVANWGIRLLIALFVVQIVSIAWSPTRMAGVRDFVFDLPVLLAMTIGETLERKATRRVVDLIALFCIAGTIQSILVVTFRLDPQLKASFIHSSIAPIFINPNELTGFFSGETNNVNSPDKSGGFFLNANVAGVFSAVMMFMSLFAYELETRKTVKALLLQVAAVHTAAVATCGSKASLVLLFVVPLVAIFLVWLQRSSLATRLAVAGTAVAAVATLISTAKAILLGTVFGRRLLLASFQRSVLWYYAAQKFKQSPLLGLGYGGWSKDLASAGSGFNALGLSPQLPPHNALIILWANSGLFAAAIGILFIVFVVHTASSIGERTGLPRVAIWATSAVTFFYIQAMGENFGVFGDPHVEVPLALFIGVLGGLKSSSGARR